MFSTSQRFLMLSALIAFAAMLGGCHTWQDSWQPVSAPKGQAWFNEKWQQTAFDNNGDGRVDRLRQWMGSGAARELHDTNFDGWFDNLVYLSYEREGPTTQQRIEAPAVPITGSSGTFDVPR
jgi:hypothetical protein